MQIALPQTSVYTFLSLFCGRNWGQEEKGTTEDEMAGWHYWLDGHEFEWTPGDGDGQGGLACCNSWGCKESDTTERLNWTDKWNCLNFIFRLYSASVQKYSFLCVDLISWNSFISFKCVCIVCIFFKISQMSTVNIVLLLPFQSICLLYLFLA